MQRTLVIFQTTLTALKTKAYWKYLSNMTPKSIRVSAIDSIFTKKLSATFLLNLLLPYVKITVCWGVLLA